MNFSPKHRIGLGLMAATMVVVLAVAGCGGSDEKSGGDTESAQQPSPSNGNAESAQQPAASSSNRQDKEKGPVAQPLGTNPLAAGNPCEAFALVGGAGAAGGLSQAFGGPGFGTSDAPQSDFAEAVAKFTEEALEQVFDGNVTADCFFEAAMGNEGLVWIAFVLPSAPPTGAGQAVGEAMTALGATVAGSSSAAIAGGTFDLVGFQALPAEAPGGATSNGGLYFVTDEAGASLAVMLVGYWNATGQGSQGIAGGQEKPSPGTGNTESAGAPKTKEVVPTGMAAIVNDQLRPALEDALGVNLIVDSFFDTTAGGTNSVSLLCAIDGDVPEIGTMVSSFTGAVEDLGGTVIFSRAFGGNADVTFDRIKISGISANGSAGFAEGRVFVTFVSRAGGS